MAQRHGSPGQAVCTAADRARSRRGLCVVSQRNDRRLDMRWLCAACVDWIRMAAWTRADLQWTDVGDSTDRRSGERTDSVAGLLCDLLANRRLLAMEWSR